MYLVRKLAVKNIDGQFSEYDLVYVKGIITEQGLENVSIFKFVRELPAATFIEYLFLREVATGRWTVEQG